MSKISSRAAKELKSAIIGTTPKARTATVATATVVSAGSDVWVQLDGADAPTPVSSTLASVSVGDTVSVRIENGSATVLGNATAPATSAAYVQQTVQPVAVAADTAQSTAETAQSAAAGAAKKADRAQETAEAVEKAVETAEADAAAAKEAADAAATKAGNLATELDATKQKVEQTVSDLEGVKTTATNAATKADESYTAATTATQTATAAQTKAESAYSNASEAITQAATATQTANSVKTELETNYVDKATASSYATKSELESTSDSITASVSKTYSTKAETQKVSDAANAAQSTANTANSTANAAQTAAATAQDTADKVAQDLATNYTTSADLKIETDAIRSSVSAVTEKANATASSVSTLEQTASDLTASVKQNAEGIGDLESLVRVSGTGVEVARKVDGEYTSSRTVIDDDGMEVQSSDGKTVFAEYGKDGAVLYSGGQPSATFSKSEVRIGDNLDTPAILAGNGLSIRDNTASSTDLRGYDVGKLTASTKDSVAMYGLFDTGNTDEYTGGKITSEYRKYDYWQRVKLTTRETDPVTYNAIALKVSDSVKSKLAVEGSTYALAANTYTDEESSTTMKYPNAGDYAYSYDGYHLLSVNGTGAEEQPGGMSLFIVIPYVNALTYKNWSDNLRYSTISPSTAYLWYCDIHTLTEGTALNWSDQTGELAITSEFKESTLTVDNAAVRRGLNVTGDASVVGELVVSGDTVSTPYGAGNITASGDLTVSGSASVAGNLTAKTAKTSGDLTVGALILNAKGREISNCNQSDGQMSFGYGAYANGCGTGVWGSPVSLHGSFCGWYGGTSSAVTIAAQSSGTATAYITVPSGFTVVGVSGISSNHTKALRLTQWGLTGMSGTVSVSATFFNGNSSAALSCTMSTGVLCVRAS